MNLDLEAATVGDEERRGQHSLRARRRLWILVRIISAPESRLSAIAALLLPPAQLPEQSCFISLKRCPGLAGPGDLGASAPQKTAAKKIIPLRRSAQPSL